MNSDSSDQHLWMSPRQVHASVEAAQAEADGIVREVGHVCGQRCTVWRLLD